MSGPRQPAAERGQRAGAAIGPLAPGSVSLGLELPPGPGATAVARLAATAVAAVEAGFDGVTLSEHHGGFPGYLPSPILVSGLLQERLPRGWAIACPAILPLRSAALVTEDLAWLAAAHPGQVAAGFVPGYQERDFELVGADFAGRRHRYWDQLSAVVGLLAGESDSALRDDPAIADAASAGVPVVSGVAGPAGARRAAAAGAGLLLMSLPSATEIAAVVEAYRDAGGAAPRVLIRRVRCGASLTGGVGAAAALGRWRDNGCGADWLARPPVGVSAGSPEEVGKQLAADLQTSGATALNLRIDVDGARPEEVDEQIGALGRETLPRVRAAFTRAPA